MNIIIKVYNRLLSIYSKQSSGKYVTFLRKKGIRIGEDNVIAAKYVQIDTSRPELLEIGNHNFLHKGTIILTHDWTGWCFLNTHGEFIPSHGKVKIGNNNWFGENVTICKGVTIGDNCIIGTGSVVTKSIPSNSIAVGAPARVISTYEDYFQKRKQRYIDEVIEYTKCIIDSGRAPSVYDYYDDYPLFVDGSNYRDYDFPYSSVFTTKESFDKWKSIHKRSFDDFEAFMVFVNKRIKDNNG